jgi:hypothetical protein
VLILVGWFGHGLSNWRLLINLSKREHLGIWLTTLGSRVIYFLSIDRFH